MLLVMSKILTITFLHLAIFVIGGLLLGVEVLGVGFSDSATLKVGYKWLVNIWKILNAPASYIFYYPKSNGVIYLLVQLVTSFIWANIYVVIWEKIKA